MMDYQRPRKNTYTTYRPAPEPDSRGTTILRGILSGGIGIVVLLALHFAYLNLHPFPRYWRTLPTPDKQLVQKQLRTFTLLLLRTKARIQHKVPILASTVFPPLTPDNITGLTPPVPNGRLPLESPEKMPGSPREYRNGTHQGVDFPGSTATKVRAVWHGQIVRIDHGFSEISKRKYDELQNRIPQFSSTPIDVLDIFRGRQVWVDHGGGIVTRYCHLSAIDDNLQTGDIIKKGQILGTVGNSGLRWTGFGAHLHFEIRSGEQYYGEGLPYDKLAASYEQLFAQ